MEEFKHIETMENSLTSIAISLKRIADLLTPKPPMTADEAERVGYKFPPNQS